MTNADRRGKRTTVLPLVRRAVSYELGMWRSLYRWIFRRPLASGPGAVAFRYAATVTPVFLAFIAVSAIEIPILHLLLPWRTAQRISLALGFYGLFWMVGLLASLRVHPHVVGDSGLRIRYGTTVDITIPWDAIGTIRTRSRPLPKGRSIHVDRTGSDPILYIGILKQTNIDVALRHSVTVPLPKGSTEPINELRFYVDDPSALVARARENLTAATR
jgi:hypothetical protein